MRAWIAFVAIFMTSTTASYADVGEPYDPPDSPHVTDYTCTLKNYEKDGMDCSRCEVEHDEYEANYDSCEEEWAPRGYHFMCGSQWKEIWCCSIGDAGICDADAGVPFIDGGVDKCTTWVTRCVGNMVQICTGGIFVNWKDCALRGGHCAYDKDGAAFCAGLAKPSDDDDPSDDLDGGVDPPAEGDRIGSCSVTLEKKRGFPIQLALVAALVGLGLLVRWRSRG